MDAGNLHSKLTLLTFFRLMVATVFLVAILLFGLSREFQTLSPAAKELAYGAVGTLLLLAAAAAALLERWQARPERLTALAYAHFVGDALFATAVVILTGGCDSLFTFFYSLAIINAGIVLYRKGALFAAVSNTVCLVMVAAGQTDLLGPGFRSVASSGLLFGDLSTYPQAAASVLPGLIINVLAFFGIAVLAGVLAEQLRAADDLALEHKHGLEELTTLHENIVSSLENGLLTVNLERRVTYGNSTAASILGLSREDLVGRRIEEIFPDMGPVLENPDKQLKSHSETTLQILGGRRVFLRWSISPLRCRSGDRIGYILLFFDISRIKEMEAEVERSERLAALGRMAANIAHEIRNPLASMSGSIQLLADTLHVEGPDRRLMEIVVREAEQLNRWITEFLEFARQKEPVIEETDIAGLAREVADMLKNDERARDTDVRCVAPATCLLRGDRTRLRQMLWNLALNALDAVRDSHSGTVSIEVSEAGDMVVVRVSDDGPGIDPAHFSRIFEPFFTTKAGGTGLGLAAVHRNVEDHRGSIDVGPGPGGRGTSFAVTLPRWTAQSPRPQQER